MFRIFQMAEVVDGLTHSVRQHDNRLVIIGLVSESLIGHTVRLRVRLQEGVPSQFRLLYWLRNRVLRKVYPLIVRNDHYLFALEIPFAHRVYHTIGVHILKTSGQIYVNHLVIDIVESIVEGQLSIVLTGCFIHAPELVSLDMSFYLALLCRVMRIKALPVICFAGSQRNLNLRACFKNSLFDEVRSKLGVVE